MYTPHNPADLDALLVWEKDAPKKILRKPEANAETEELKFIFEDGQWFNLKLDDFLNQKEYIKAYFNLRGKLLPRLSRRAYSEFTTELPIL